MLSIYSFDDRRDIAIPGDQEEAIRFAVEHWISTAEEAIAKRSFFSVALSGGSTPHAIYQMLSQAPYASRLDWSKVYLFWSDERAVPPDHPDSNYHMAMKSGLSRLPLISSHIFRMEAERKIEANALAYEAIIRRVAGPGLFDLVMLGVGEDGHTASLFPHTSALAIEDRLVVPNWVEEKKSWRMTLTFSCIRQSKKAVIYALGDSKKSIVNEVLHASESSYPASRIGAPSKKSLWIIDNSAAALLRKRHPHSI